MDTLLPYMTVGTPAANVYTSDESLDAFDIIVNKIGADHLYTNTRIARWTFRAQRGSRPVSLQLDCVAESETDNGATTYTPNAVPGQIYAFTGSAFTYVGAPHPIDRVAIISDMNIFKQWNNSITLTDAILTTQNTYIATSVPYVATTEGIFWGNRSVVTKRLITVSFTSGADVLTFTFPAAVLVPKSPDIVNKMSEIRLPLTWQAHIDTSANPDTPAFNITHVNS
jgi:hypothetical protein